MPVGLGELVQVLRAPHPAHVPQLIGRKELEHEQIGVLLLDHAARLGGQRAVDLGGGLHRGHRPDHVLAERVQQVGDPHELAGAAVPFEDVEDRLAPHAEAGREVRPHPVLRGRGPREHRREAHDRPCRIRRVDREVLRA
ncbi:MAG TPA: hypothetical protein VM824_01090, partial [Thermoleophilaceae bacterium]|nr:hypothetical protein [Thermoleophilaceae bacterium]